MRLQRGTNVCRGKARLAGVARRGELAKMPLFGAEGMALVTYLGEKEGCLPTSVFTMISYPYHKGRTFYVDTRDLSRTLAWMENGRLVFAQAEDA